jgi:hypothetical protein
MLWIYPCKSVQIRVIRVLRFLGLLDLSVQIRPIRVEEILGHGYTQMNTDKKTANTKSILDLSVRIRAIRVIRVQELLGHGYTQIHTNKKKKKKPFLRFICENPCNPCYPCSKIFGFIRAIRVQEF